MSYIFLYKYYVLSYLFVLPLVVVGGCQFTEIQPSKPQIKDPKKPSQQIEGVALEILEDGKPKLRVRAGKMARFERGDSVFALLEAGKSKNQVMVDIFDEAGLPSAKINMDKLRFEEATLHLTATGNVQVEAGKGRRLQAEHLVWDNLTRKLSAKGLVKIISDKEQLQGYDLVTDETMTNYSARKLTGQVRVSGL
ncbi:MAG: hypothetical protein J0L94_10730 [Rhodothermia bacterium]|nr:hypothetical protein [Rhodothermia bacterium]